MLSFSRSRTLLRLVPAITLISSSASAYLSPKCETQQEVVFGGLSCQNDADCKGHVSEPLAFVSDVSVKSGPRLERVANQGVLPEALVPC